MAGQDERHPDGNARYGLYRRQQGNEGKPENPDISGGGEEEDPLG